MTDDALVMRVRAIVSEMCKGDRWRMCIPPQADDSDMAISELADRFDRLRTLPADALLEAATDLGGKLLEAWLEHNGQIEAAGYLVTFTDDADLCAWKLPLASDDQGAEVVFFDEADAFAWLSERAALAGLPSAGAATREAGE